MQNIVLSFSQKPNDNLCDAGGDLKTNSRAIVTLRDVDLREVTACEAIEAACFSATEAASYERIEQRAVSYPQGFIVAVQDNEIVGFINSGPTNEDDLSRENLKDGADFDAMGQNLVIFSVAIRPDLQGGGVSRLLMEALLMRARELNKQAVLLLCKEYLVPYYFKFGFCDLGPSASTHGGYLWRQMRLAL